MFILELFVYFCDFYREQFWDRWLKVFYNCIGNDKLEILNFFRFIVYVNIIEEFNMVKLVLEVIKLMYVFNEFIIFIQNSGYV